MNGSNVPNIDSLTDAELATFGQMRTAREFQRFATNLFPEHPYGYESQARLLRAYANETLLARISRTLQRFQMAIIQENESKDTLKALKPWARWETSSDGERAK